MWRAIRWMVVVGLSFAVSKAAGQESTNAHRMEARPALKVLTQGQVAEAVQLFSQAFLLSEEHLRQEAPGLSESRLTQLLRSLRPDEERIYALLRAYPNDPRVQRLAMMSVLLRHGRSLDEAASTSRLIHHGLASGSASLSARTSLPLPVDIIDRVAAGLPRDSALIEFVAYVDRPLVSKPGTPVSQESSQLRYLALMLFPDARIRAIDLGPAAAIDSAATNLSNALADKDAAYQVHAETLYARVFRPLQPLLANTRRIYLVLDGQLGLIPFDALHDGSRALIDVFDFTYLTSGRDLLPRPEAIPSSDSVAVFADPILGSVPSTHSFTGASGFATTRLPSLFMELPTLRGELADTPWLPLPGTRQEAEAIQRMYPQARLFLGANATKERLLHLTAPAVLHIATHGYVLDGATATGGSRGLGHVGPFSGPTSAPQPQDSMLRAGLVLSNPGKLQEEGAMVTARELAGMNLWGTALVVLSACDTGRGEVELGQGIYGLRRAFLIAGAETVVTSLWKVNDDATRLLMESYYRNLRAGQGRGEALREAMRTLRKTHPHPHDWAAFVTQGRDTPLRLLYPKS